MSRLNSLTLTLIDAPDGAVETDIEHYTPPRPPFTPAESLMMHLMHCLQEVSEDETNESHSHDTPETSQEALQRGQGTDKGTLGGTNVVVIGSRTERSRGIVE